MDKNITSVEVLSKTGNLCKIITGVKSKVRADGNEVKTKSNKDGSIEFETIKGKTYKVVQL